MRGIVPWRVTGPGGRACYGPDMATATPRSRHAARLRADRRRAQARSRRIAIAVVIGVLAAATLALTAFDGESSPAVSRPAPLPVTSAPPERQILATVGNLRLETPVAQGGVTAVGFHGSAEGALVLKPVGPQRNEGLLARLWHRITGASKTGLAWYQLSGGPLRTLDVGAVAGTDVYSPVDGTVVAIRDQIVSGEVVGSEIELRPALAPSLVVSIQHVRPDPALSVGANVAAGSSKLGTVTNISRYEQQALRRYAAESGNNVALQVYPSATLGVP
jgi:murein DD-endopeptidase MepM/ murein hydrolase activator NlpD